MNNKGITNIKKELDASGFVRVEHAFLPQELDACETIIDSLMQRNNIPAKLLKSSMSENPTREKNQQTEFTRPSTVAARLKNSSVFKSCHKMAQEYFNGKAHYLFDHAIYKMPGSKTITPWHQDQAYAGMDIIPSIHFWIPFQDTTANNGAMQFIKGSHHSIYPHEQAYPQNPHILRAMNIPTEGIYTMDINKGDTSVHTNLTLHSATANNSEHIRKAWIIHFGHQPQWHKHWLTFKSRILNK